MKVLLIGSGGREHSLVWKLNQSDLVSELTCLPGNAGIAEIANIVPIKAHEIEKIIKHVILKQYDFVIIGPEQPLALGIVDKLKDIGIKVFGPTQSAARLESSKEFTKKLCSKYNIPTAKYGVFDNLKDAKSYIKKMRAPYVIKADGLASGKGVVLPETLDGALKELEEIFSGKFGDASSKVLIEEFMEGQEASFFAISDGVNILPLIAAQDHKRAFDGDKGPNTGGMGAYSPTPVFNEEIQKIVMNKIIIPTVEGMAADGTPYVGILFAGLMITNEGPKLIEYNARFGDPECQVLMRRLNSDLMDIFLKAEEGNLDAIKELIWSNKPTVNIVLANNGYPGKYKNGSIIKGIDKANSKNEIVIFHAGTKYNENNNICSAGGRVLNVTSQADTLNKALEKAYEAIDNDIEWDDGFCRRDIGYQAVC